jgi:hypothetical protein
MLDGPVDAAALNPPDVVEKNDPAIAPGTRLDDFYRSIGAPAIRNDDLSNNLLGLCREVIQDALNVVFLIQTGNDHDGRRRRARKLI